MNTNHNKTNQKIGFIGCGKMASAIIKGVISSNFIKSEDISASEVSQEFAKAKSEELKIKVIQDNKEIAKNSDVIFLATKPNYIKEVLEEIKDELNSNKLIVSIAAGISTTTIESLIGNIPTIRVMPNAPAMIKEGMSGIVKGKFASDSDAEFVNDFLTSIGKCIIVEESQIDVVTAISGSGPAFFYQIINEMAKAGEKLGLDYEKSLLLSAQTAIGSAKLLMQSEFSPEELVKSVATKGGCTEVGIDFMKESKTEDLFSELIEKTAKKANDLGK